MKKILSLFGVVALAASSTTIVFANKTNRDTIRTKKDHNSYWNDMNLSINNHFDNLLIDKKEQTFSISTQKNDENNMSEEMILKSKEFSNYYLERFKNNNISFDDMISQLKEDLPEFKSNLEEKINEQKIKDYTEENISSETINFKSLDTNKGISSLTINSLDPKEIFKKFDEQEVKINKLLTELYESAKWSWINAGAASLVAAGYWAASWWFGLTIPGAWAATAVAASSILIAGGTHLLYEEYKNINIKFMYHKGTKHLLNSIKIFNSILSLTRNASNVQILMMISNSTIITTNSWAFFPGFAYAGYVMSAVNTFFSYKTLIDVFF